MQVGEKRCIVPLVGQLPQTIRHTGMPPFPVSRVPCKPVPGRGRYECRVLSRVQSAIGFKSEVSALHTRSKAAILLFFPASSSLRSGCSDVLLLSYLPTMRLLLTIRHVIFSGFFCDAGVKNEAIAASKLYDQHWHLRVKW